MSRIGNQILTIPNGVSVEYKDNQVVCKGSLGTLNLDINHALEVIVNENNVEVKRNNEEKFTKSIHGTTTALIKNMIKGVSEGFSKELELNGVGYRVSVSGNKVTLNVGYSHPVELEMPAGISVEAPSNTSLIVKGIDKQLVGEISANIRKVRAPEPYKGKGIKYKDEHIRRKEGKRAGK